jgi:hypothetical protein
MLCKRSTKSKPFLIAKISENAQEVDQYLRKNQEKQLDVTKNSKSPCM